MALQKITEKRLAYTFCVPGGKFSKQTINILQEAEVILKNIEKCNVSSLMNKRSISYWLNLDFG